MLTIWGLSCSPRSYGWPKKRQVGKQDLPGMICGTQTFSKCSSFWRMSKASKAGTLVRTSEDSAARSQTGSSDGFHLLARLGLQEGDVLPEQRQPSQPLATSLGRADGRADHGSSCRTRLGQTGRPSLGTHEALTQSRSHSARRRDERPSLNRLSPSGLGRLFITPLTVARGMC